MKRAFFDAQLRSTEKKNAVLIVEKNMRNGYLKYERIRIVENRKQKRL